MCMCVASRDRRSAIPATIPCAAAQRISAQYDRQRSASIYYKHAYLYVHLPFYKHTTTKTTSDSLIYLLLKN